MVVSRGILIFLIIGAVSASIACGGVSTGTSSGASQVSIALNPAPSTTSVPVGSTTGIQFTPVVSHDPSNSGVDWAMTCPVSDCGTLSIPNGGLHSASGTAVTYLPPASFLTGSLVVNVTVFATADHAQNLMTPVTVTSYTGVLNGNYVLQVMGNDGNAYQATGVFTFDGNGNVTSGQETIDSLVSGLTSGFLTSAYTLQGASVPSTYFIGPDGRGVITLNLQQSNNGPRPPFSQTFTLVVLSTSQALITELDGNPVTTSASGTLELQDSTAIATTPCATITSPCAYAFVTNGTDGNTSNGPLLTNGPAPTAIGGVINIDNMKPDNTPSPGSISGNGSLADQHYFNASGMPMLESCAPPAGVTGSVSLQTGSPGVVTITLTGANCFATSPFSNPGGTIQFTGYIVDATRIRLIESDNFSGQTGFLTAGIAVMQSSAGTFSNGSLSGSYVYGVLGYDMSSSSPPYTPSSFTSAGEIQADGSGNLTTGSSDILFASTTTAFTANGQPNIITPSTYAVDPTGRADLTPSFSGPSTLQPAVLFYLTGNGTPSLVLWSGDDVNLPAVGTGIAYPQTARTLSFGNSEKYGLSFTQYNAQSSPPTVNGSGDMTSAVTSIAVTLSGTVDDGSSNGSACGTGVCLLDAFNPQADSFGSITGTFLNAVSSTPPSLSGDYYLVDDNKGFFVETDLTTSSTVSLGNFGQACDVTSATSCQMAPAAAGSPKRAPAPRGRN